MLNLGIGMTRDDYKESKLKVSTPYLIMILTFIGVVIYVALDILRLDITTLRWIAIIALALMDIFLVSMTYVVYKRKWREKWPLSFMTLYGVAMLILCVWQTVK